MYVCVCVLILCPRDRALKRECEEGWGRGGAHGWGGVGSFVSLCIALMFCNDPMGCGSGEYCTVFSLPITMVTKSLGLGGVEVEAGAGGQSS